MRESRNISLLLVVVGGYILCLWVTILLNRSDRQLSLLAIATVYYAIVALIDRRRSFLLFVATTTPFLIASLSLFRYSHISLDSIESVLLLDTKATRLFALVLLPAVFFGTGADIFELPSDLRRLGMGRFVLRVLMPVLIKREHIRTQFVIIRECMESRGIAMGTRADRIRSVLRWAVPLGMAAIFEGADTSDYNAMLGTDITCLPEVLLPPFVSLRQKLCALTLFMLFATGGYTWISMAL